MWKWGVDSSCWSVWCPSRSKVFCTDMHVGLQHALRLLAFRQIHKVLAMDPLPPPRLHRQRFNNPRKRRHTGSGEGTEDGTSMANLSHFCSHSLIPTVHLPTGNQNGVGLKSILITKFCMKLNVLVSSWQVTKWVCYNFIFDGKG